MGVQKRDILVLSLTFMFHFQSRTQGQGMFFVPGLHQNNQTAFTGGLQALCHPMDLEIQCLERDKNSVTLDSSYQIVISHQRLITMRSASIKTVLEAENEKHLI